MRHIPVEVITKSEFYQKFKEDALVLFAPDEFIIEYKPKEIHIRSFQSKRTLFIITFDGVFIYCKMNKEFDNDYNQETYEVLKEIIAEIAP